MTDLTALTPIGTPVATDLMYIVDDPASTKLPRNVTLQQIIDLFSGLARTITGVMTFGEAGDVGKLKVAGNTSGETIISATAVAGSGTVTLPTTGILVAQGGALGTPSSGTATNLTGTASGLTAGNVTTNANLTGDVTSVGNATTTVTNANLTGDVTSVGNATTTVTNANLTGDVTSVGNATTTVTNANLTGDVTSVGNAATVITNANLTGDVTSSGNATTLATIKDVNGVQEDVIYAGSMIDADGTTNATAEFTTRYAATNNSPVQSYNFDTAVDEYCYFDWRPVEQWDAGTVLVKAVWNNIAGLTTETIELEVSAVAFSDNATEVTAFGTPQNITDTWLAQNAYQSTAYSSAITIASTPAKGDLVKFQVMRDISADNLTGDLELCKIIIQYSIDAATSV